MDTPTNGYSRYHIDNDRERLLGFNLHISGDANSNAVWLHPQMTRLPRECYVAFSGSGNMLQIDRDCGLSGRIWFDGQNATATIHGGQGHAELLLQLYDDSRLSWGRGSRTYGAKIWIHGRRAVIVGEDCLMADNIAIRSSDHHSIIDLNTMQQLNDPADVVLGNHVWIGAGCYLMKGATMGDGSILATGSVLTAQVPARQLWAGVPARSIRDNVSWVDSHPAEPGHIEAMRRMLDIPAR